MELLSLSAHDTLECRIETVFNNITETQLCPLTNDEPLTVDQFTLTTQDTCTEATSTLNKSVGIVLSPLVVIPVTLPLSPCVFVIIGTQLYLFCSTLSLQFTEITETHH